MWRTARLLDRSLTGQAITVCDLRWPSLATVDLRGREVLAVVSIGKHLMQRCAGDLTLHSHLRMEGSWRVSATGAAAPDRSPQTRAVIGNPVWTAIGRRLGMLDVVPTSREDRLVGHLGPDLLGPGWDAAEAARRLAADGARPVGEALLDQRVLAGLGTFYVCEACFLRGVSPWTPVAGAGDPAAFVELAHRLITANRDRTTQVTTGDARRGQEQYVHARSGLPCRRCGATVRVAAIGAAPTDRAAFYCPRCQPGPTPTDDGRRQAPLGHRRPRARGSGYGRH